MLITAYTDYPIEDGTFETGMKQIQVLSYDRNKYCTVLRNGFEDEIKAGYIYLDKEGKKLIRQRTLLRLPLTPEEQMRTQHQLANERRAYKEVKTTYYVYADPSGRGHPISDKIRISWKFKSKIQALKHFKKLCNRKVDARICVDVDKMFSWSRYETVMYYDKSDDTWSYYGRKKPFSHKILARHGFKV